MDSATPPTEGKERSSKLNGTHFFLSCLSKPQSLSFPIHGFLPANYNGLKSNWQLREEDGFFSSIITILARSTPMLGAFHAIKKMKSLLKKNPLDYCCLFFFFPNHTFWRCQTKSGHPFVSSKERTDACLSADRRLSSPARRRAVYCFYHFCIILGGNRRHHHSHPGFWSRLLIWHLVITHFWFLNVNELKGEVCMFLLFGSRDFGSCYEMHF